MKELMMKARSGVTLVELLVVILIVTILSVSLLPMFKEYICQAQYAAEAIPVIGNLRTKIGLYQYDHSVLPPNSTDDNKVSTWEVAEDDTEKYLTAEYTIGTAPGSVAPATGDKYTDLGKTPVGTYTDANGQSKGSAQAAGHVHFGSQSMLDIDFQDLKGKRSRPYDYFYFNIPCSQGTDSAYIVGCFGAGRGGFAEGTGYAVCELNLVSQGKKYIGTFERYKAKTKSGSCPYLYLSDSATGVSGDTVYCPKQLTATDIAKGTSDLPNIVNTMENAGWKFTK